jgi:hypothetical protein
MQTERAAGADYFGGTEFNRLTGLRSGLTAGIATLTARFVVSITLFEFAVTVIV